MNHLSAAVHFISWRYHQCSNQSSYKMYWPMFGVRRVDCQHQRFSSYDMCDWPFFRDNSFDVLNNRPPRSFHGWIISHHLASFGPKVNVYMQYNWPPFYILHRIFVFIGMKKETPVMVRSDVEAGMHASFSPSSGSQPVMCSGSIKIAIWPRGPQPHSSFWIR